jgi:hypothetical protein
MLAHRNGGRGERKRERETQRQPTLELKGRLCTNGGHIWTRAINTSIPSYLCPDRCVWQGVRKGPPSLDSGETLLDSGPWSSQNATFALAEQRPREIGSETVVSARVFARHWRVTPRCSRHCVLCSIPMFTQHGVCVCAPQGMMYLARSIGCCLWPVHAARFSPLMIPPKGRQRGRV